MQRGLSAFDFKVIVYELQEIIGSYIENIYQYSADEILIKINNKTTNQKETIFVRNSDLLCITQQKFNVPEKPSVFAMTLRKYLLNGKITKITQHDFDRIIFLHIEKKDEEYTLVLEFIPKGNIILLNQNGMIIVPLVRQQWAHRCIKIHENYVLPPTQINPFELTFESFSDILHKSSKDLVRFFAVTLNFGGVYAEEFLLRAGFDKNIQPQNLKESEIYKLFAAVQLFLDVFRQNVYDPICILRDGKTVDVLPVPFLSFKNEVQQKCIRFVYGLQSSISKPQKTQIQPSASEQKKASLQRQLHQQQESIQAFEKAIYEKKKEGEIIYLNIDVISRILRQASDILKQKDKTAALKILKQNSLVQDVDLVNQKITIKVLTDKNEYHPVTLDIYKSSSDNAQQAYTESKKLSEKLQGALAAFEKTQTELKNIEKSIEQEADVVLKKEKKQLKTFWFEQFRWFITSEGNIVVGGRDAKSNELVVKKHLREGDRYVHADIHGAPSVVVKTKNIHDEKISISEKSLEEACVFAASFSKAWNQFAEAQAYWVHPEQVSKTPQSGEYVPRGGFIIRGKRNYQRCKLELAVGKISLDDVEKIMCCPESALQRFTDKYLVITPGGIKKPVAAQKIAKLFSVSSEQIDQVLPPGTIRISRSIGLLFEEGERS